jgi:Holliday junction resolvasome RuvABC endonuclease subunit
VSAERVITGIDLSLSNVGIATVLAGAELRTSTLTLRSSGRQKPTIPERWQRLETMVQQITRRIGAADVVVIEGPSLRSRYGPHWDTAALWWAVVGYVLRTGATLGVAPPTVVKRFATGSGKADKSAVAAGMTRLWPDVDAHGEHEFDALTLATMGAQYVGVDVPRRAHHAGALESVEWVATFTLEIWNDWLAGINAEETQP